MAFTSENPILFESVSAVTTANSVELGTRTTQGGSDYIYVYNAGAATISQSCAAVLSATTGYSVTGAAVTMLDFGIGIAKNAAIPAASYGWLMTRGFSTFIAGADDSFAVGDAIAVAVSGLFGHKTISTGYVTPHVGKCIQAAASAASTGYGYFSFL